VKYDKEGKLTKKGIVMVLVGVILMFVSLLGHAQQKGTFGLGFIIGNPTGISMKFWTKETDAVEVAVGWKKKETELHADYLWHNFELLPVENGRLPVFYGLGIGVKLKEDKDNEIGIRTIAGLEYLFPTVPFDFFLQIAPMLQLTPESKVKGEAALGFRFFFK
jgi:hypothetical protein